MEFKRIVDGDAHLKNWFEVYNESFKIDYNNDTLEGIEYYVRLSNQEVRAECYGLFEDNLIQSGVMIFIKDNYVWILYLFTDAAHRNKGLGNKLMDELNKIYQVDSYNYILEVEERDGNKSIADWWKKRGFEKVPFDYTAPLMNDETGEEIDVIHFNDLYMRQPFSKAMARALLDLIEVYFKYGFCFDDVEVKGFHAFMDTKESISRFF